MDVHLHLDIGQRSNCMNLGRLIKVGEIRACGDFSEMLEVAKMLEDRGLAVV